MAPAEPQASSFTVEVVYAPAPRTVDVQRCELSPGATLLDALNASGLLSRHGLVCQRDQILSPAGEVLGVGVWSKPQPLDHPLRGGDRVELWRPLRVDPKEARRQRYRRDKERSRQTPSL